MLAISSRTLPFKFCTVQCFSWTLSASGSRKEKNLEILILAIEGATGSLK